MTTSTHTPVTYVDTLNHLIEVCLDGEIGYLYAAEWAGTNKRLATLFREFVRQHQVFITDLANVVVGLSGEPASNREAKGTPQHAWLNIQAALSDNDEKAILDECHRGENTAIAIYEAAMTRALPDYIFNIIQSQYEQLTLIRKHLLEQLESLNTQEKKS